MPGQAPRPGDNIAEFEAEESRQRALGIYDRFEQRLAREKEKREQARRYHQSRRHAPP